MDEAIEELRRQETQRRGWALVIAGALLLWVSRKKNCRPVIKGRRLSVGIRKNEVSDAYLRESPQDAAVQPGTL